jgi:hypothetical protein
VFPAQVTKFKFSKTSEPAENKILHGWIHRVYIITLNRWCRLTKVKSPQMAALDFPIQGDKTSVYSHTNMNLIMKRDTKNDTIVNDMERKSGSL